jgi:hypothetical protein
MGAFFTILRCHCQGNSFPLAKNFTHPVPSRLDLPMTLSDTIKTYVRRMGPVSLCMQRDYCNPPKMKKSKQLEKSVILGYVLAGTRWADARSRASLATGPKWLENSSAKRRISGRPGNRFPCETGERCSEFLLVYNPGTFPDHHKLIGRNI